MFRTLLISAGIVTLFVSPAFAAFEVGVASTDITPEPGAPMWGYSNRESGATGTIDPLFARTAVFRTEDKTIALVTLDLGRVPLKDACDRIRVRAKAKGVDGVLFTASHTHSAPSVDVEGPHTEHIEAKIGDSIEAALAKLQPAKVGVGRTTIDIAHNRRKILDNGQCMMVWRNVEQIPTGGPVDNEAGIIKITAEDGSPIAVLVNYSCHPVVLGPDNLDYSADFVGEMARVVKERTGAECLFLQGGCGDINPYMDKTPVDEGGVKIMRDVGRTAAYAVVAELPAITPAKPANPSLEFSREYVNVGTRWDVSNPEVQKVLKTVYGPLFDKYLADLDPNLAVPYSVLILNGDLAFVGMPGEMFTQFQLDLKTHSPIKNTFLVGYSDEFHIYFPTVKDAVARGYGAIVNTYVGLGAGDKLVKESVIEMGKLMGELKAIPEVEDFFLLEGDATDETAQRTEN